MSKVEEECRFRDVAHEVAVAGIQCDADAVALFSPQKLEEFATILEKEPLDPNWGSGLNGAKLVGIWDDFRRPLFDVGGGPFLCEVLSSSGSSLGGVF